MGEEEKKQDYWASTAFTGAVGFGFGAMAIIWLALLIVWSIFKSFGCCCRRESKDTRSLMPTLVQRTTLVLWTAGVLIGAMLLFSSSSTASENFEKANYPLEPSQHLYSCLSFCTLTTRAYDFGFETRSWIYW